jgi:hypothetical protein
MAHTYLRVNGKGERDVWMFMIKVGNFGGRKETKRQAILQKKENYQMVEERWKWQHWNDEK